MTIQVAVHHHSHYHFDRPVFVFPHEIRMRPLANGRAAISAYVLKVRPGKHTIHWQQDLQGNCVARLTMPDLTDELSLTVDLIAEIGAINPFDFLVEPWAEYYPFEYPEELGVEVAPFVRTESPGPVLSAWMREFRNALSCDMTTIQVLVCANQSVWRSVSYRARMESGIQSCEDTLVRGSGSCRDSAWLLVQVLRHLGIAARFVSGYLIQTARTEVARDGAGIDTVSLHAWCEAYVPGAGWVGLDATSGLLAGDGHVALAATTQPALAAPVQGRIGTCEARLEVTMSATRKHDPQRSECSARAGMRDPRYWLHSGRGPRTDRRTE